MYPVLDIVTVSTACAIGSAFHLATSTFAYVASHVATSVTRDCGRVVQRGSHLSGQVQPQSAGDGKTRSLIIA